MEALSKIGSINTVLSPKRQTIGQRGIQYPERFALDGE